MRLARKKGTFSGTGGPLLQKTRGWGSEITIHVRDLEFLGCPEFFFGHASCSWISRSRFVGFHTKPTILSRRGSNKGKTRLEEPRRYPSRLGLHGGVFHSRRAYHPPPRFATDLYFLNFRFQDVCRFAQTPPNAWFQRSFSRVIQTSGGNTVEPKPFRVGGRSKCESPGQWLIIRRILFFRLLGSS